jgi:hypothetical protein
MGIFTRFNGKTVQLRHQSKCAAGLGRGPPNIKSAESCAVNLVNASFIDVVNPNSDTLYCLIQIDFTKEPVVIVVPSI